jgi:hypothetical protein
MQIAKYVYEYSGDTADAIVLYENDVGDALLYVCLKHKNSYFKDSYDFICRAKLLCGNDNSYWYGEDYFPIHKVKSQEDLQNILKVFNIQKELDIVEAKRIFQ